MTRPDTLPRHSIANARLPLAGLLALAATGFITLLTETMPAGVLPGMSRDLGVSETAAGQSVTVFAIGAILAAIPLTKATIGWPRRHLLLVAIAGFAIANTVTALSESFALTLAPFSARRGK
jgi:predicted MFS family arabinose efflux permease